VATTRLESSGTRPPARSVGRRPAEPIGSRPPPRPATTRSVRASSPSSRSSPSSSMRRRFLPAVPCNIYACMHGRACLGPMRGAARAAPVHSAASCWAAGEGLVSVRVFCRRAWECVPADQFTSGDVENLCGGEGSRITFRQRQRVRRAN
jgi:hypothetical protein